MPTLQDGRDAIESGNVQQARLIFQSILQENPRDEDAWLGLADAVTEEDDKRVCYENVLKINKNNRAAKDGLRDLEPKENPLVAALGSQFGRGEPEDGEFDDDADEETVTAPRPAFTPMPDESETPTAVLVAVGFALSVFVFAIFGTIIFFTLTSIAGS